jgi:16S rRNA (cytidine1402-2'-O)-methyltransferase
MKRERGPSTDSKSPRTESRGGTLYVVGTPIGNLEDVTFRALRVLGEVAVIAAEDTRVTRKLLARYDIHTPLISYHRHSPDRRAEEILAHLERGEDVALVSDAGMPGIADPGHELIVACIAAGYAVVPVPGPTALATSLVVSGLPTDSFVFVGFLPRAASRRRELLRSLAEQPRTLVFFESPHRLVETLQVALEVLGDRRAALVRELTKKFEEVLRGPLSEITETLRGREVIGEATVLIAGATAAPAAPVDVDEAVARVERLVEGGSSMRDAVRAVAEATGLSRRALYEQAQRRRA